MKKIFIFYPNIFPIYNGASVHGYNLIKELSKNKYKIITIKQKKSQYYEVANYKNIIELHRALSDCDYIYYRVPLNNVTKFERFLSLFPKSKKILEVNAPVEELISEHGLKSIPKGYRKIYSWKIRQAKYYVVVSIILKDYLVNKWNVTEDKIIVAPNGCNPDYFSKNYKGKTFLNKIKKTKVFWAGNPSVGFQDVENIYAIAESFQHREDIVFIFGGLSNVDSTYSNVITLPKLNYSEVYKYINDSDILLAFYGDYKWSDIGFYGSSLKFFEYMASGNPVIAPRKGQIAEISTHLEDAYLYDTREEIIKGIEVLAKDHSLRENIGKNGAKLVKTNYTWEKSVKGIIDLLEN